MRSKRSRCAPRGEPRRMSCWVVPTVAAEMWGVPVSAVLEKMRSGNFPTKPETVFAFIDFPPASPTVDAPKFQRPPRPPTYTLVTGAELDALAPDMNQHGLDENGLPPLPIEEWR